MALTQRRDEFGGAQPLLHPATPLQCGTPRAGRGGQRPQRWHRCPTAESPAGTPRPRPRSGVRCVHAHHVHCSHAFVRCMHCTPEHCRLPRAPLTASVSPAGRCPPPPGGAANTPEGSWVQAAPSPTPPGLQEGALRVGGFQVGGRCGWGIPWGTSVWDFPALCCGGDPPASIPTPKPPMGEMRQQGCPPPP